MELQECGDIGERAATTTTTTMTTTTTATTATAAPTRVVETLNPPEILSLSISQGDVMTPGPESMPNVPESSYCRICGKGSKSETLQTLCNCLAPIGLIHIRCLNRQLTVLDVGYCIYCSYVFETERTRTPIYQWTRHKGQFIMWMLIGCLIIGSNTFFAEMILSSVTGHQVPSLFSYNIDPKIIFFWLMLCLSLCGYCRWSRFMLDAWDNWSDHNCRRRVIIEPHREADDVASSNNEDAAQDIEKTPA